MEVAVLNLRRVARLTLFIRVGASAMTFVFIAFLSRTMPGAEFGLVAVVLNASFLSSIVSARGQQMALVRDLPRCRTPVEEWATIRAAGARTASGTAAVMAIAAFCFAAARLGGFVDGYSVFDMASALAVLAAVSAADFWSHVARGLHRHVLSLLPKEFLWRGVTCALLATVLAARLPSASSVLLSMAATLAVLSIGQAAIILFPIRKVLLFGKRDTGFSGQTGHAFWVSSVSNVFLSSFDTIAVGLLLGPHEAAGYFVANRIAIALSFFQSAQNLVLSPTVAGLADARGPIASLSQGAARRMTVPTVLFGLIIACFPASLLAVFGQGDTSDVTVLRLLVLAAVANAALGPGDIVLNMCGHEHRAARVAATNLLAGALLITGGAIAFGAAGAACAVFSATVLRKAMYWSEVRATCGIRVDCLAGRSGGVRFAGSEYPQP